MDFDENDPAFEEILNSTDFPAHYDQLELDSLLFGDSESPESSSSYGFCEQNAGYRSRDSGSMGNSSTDSSPPLSCANFTENDQEMWEFGFQNPSPFESLNPPFDNSYQEEQQFTEHNDEYMEPQYIDHTEEVIEEEPVPIVHAPRKQVITIMPRVPQVPVKRVATGPIQKVYRIKEIPVTQRAQSFRIVQQVNPQQVVRKQQPLQQRQPIQHRQVVQQRQPIQQRQAPKRVYFTQAQHVEQEVEDEEDEEECITSGPLIRQTTGQEKQQRYVPIAPTKMIKQEVQKYTPEQTRKIRNRMYAQASRTRKKELDEEMRQNIQDLAHENQVLKNENNYLRRRLAYYENETPQLHGPQPILEGKTLKKRKLMMAGTALMMFGLFAVISPFHLMNSDGSMGMNTQIMAITNESSALARHGRVLGNEGSTAVIRKAQENMHRYNNSSLHDCEMYKLNATETRRVNNDIERWVQVHSFDNVPVKLSGGLANKEAMRKFNDAQRGQKASAFGPLQESVQKKTDQAAIRSRERTWRQLDLLKAGNDLADNEKLQRKRQNIAKVATILRQKGDTLYIITLQDYVLLPSLSKGANSIPKLSLLLPSVPMNGTLLDQYSLLRVDCEVTGTGQLTLSNKQLSYLMP